MIMGGPTASAAPRPAYSAPGSVRSAVQKMADLVRSGRANTARSAR
eukprot:CAMPEP_0171220048 /NCGR_PEP_ID=MMETSP0790-20130122/34033_1 /TAXON_ID=2925 /ORGANISM="Alexandrium catenella, Strain OF101" /LENGTH=45 /DNA_ID= /DNA_START= /DNA_END= /DNA_ORIENTATION=